MRVLIFKGLEKDQVPIKICFSPTGLDPEKENQHVFHDHKHSVARSEWWTGPGHRSELQGAFAGPEIFPVQNSWRIVSVTW